MSIKSSDSIAPGRDILQAFGINGEPTLVAGGRGLCFRVGMILFKPAEHEAEAQWVSQLAARVLDWQPSQYRLARPLAVISNSDDYVFRGWTASSFLNGAVPPRMRFEEIIAVARAFSADLAEHGIDKPTFIDQRVDRWSEADRVTWGEKALKDVKNVDSKILQYMSPILETLKAMVKPLPPELGSQLIHSDLTGNILFDEENRSPPGIIDLTMYWRPSAYAEAIIVADGLTWHGEGSGLIELYGTDDIRLQLLVRAMYWRNITYAIDPDVDWIRQHMHKGDFQGALETLKVHVKGRE